MLQIQSLRREKLTPLKTKRKDSRRKRKKKTLNDYWYDLECQGEGILSYIGELFIAKTIYNDSMSNQTYLKKGGYDSLVGWVSK